MLGTIISAVAYGIVVVLSGNCFLLLQRNRGIYSNRMRLFLLIYVLVMFLFSTSSMIQSICTITLFIFRGGVGSPILTGYSAPVMLPLTIWGADGFMIWRCFVLYQDITRVPRILVIILLSLLSIISLGFGIMMFRSFGANLVGLTMVLVPISFSTLVNIILALLIVLRLIHHQRYIRKVLGADHGSPYSKVIAICVESSALIVIFSGVYTALVFQQANGSSIPFLLLPHICVISPLLIVYRVAKGRAMTTTLQPSEAVTAQIRFNNPTSNCSSENKEI